MGAQNCLSKTLDIISRALYTKQKSFHQAALSANLILAVIYLFYKKYE